MSRMLKTYTVSFFGHRQIDDVFKVEQALEEIVCRLLREKEYVEFLVGRDGEFDQLVSSTVKRCKRRIGESNSALVWVLPYPTAELRDNEDAFGNYYDEIEICGSSTGKHFKAAFQVRNRSMVDRSDLVVFCVERKSGGAYQTMRYAVKIKASFINLLEAEQGIISKTGNLQNKNTELTRRLPHDL